MFKLNRVLIGFGRELNKGKIRFGRKISPSENVPLDLSFFWLMNQFLNLNSGHPRTIKFCTKPFDHVNLDNVKDNVIPDGRPLLACGFLLKLTFAV